MTRTKMRMYIGDQLGRVAAVEVEADADRRVAHRVRVHARAVAWKEERNQRMFHMNMKMSVHV